MADEYMSESAAPPAAEESPAEEQNVAVIPKSFFPGDKPLEPGNECTVKIEEVQDESVLVSYSHSAASEPAAAPSAPPDPEMQEYMS